MRIQRMHIFPLCGALFFSLLSLAGSNDQFGFGCNMERVGGCDASDDGVSDRGFVLDQAPLFCPSQVAFFSGNNTNLMGKIVDFAATVPTYPAGMNFGLPSNYSTIWGDFNGDGKTDYARLGGIDSFFFFSNGDGSFSNVIQKYPSGWDFGCPTNWTTIVGDFNGDSKSDYARLGPTYSHFFLSNGDGTFSNPIHSYPSGWNFGLPSSWEAITGDFNGDMKSDYARFGAKYVHLFFSNGDGTFANPIFNYPNGWDFGCPSQYTTVAGDFNGDWRTDFIRLSGQHYYVFLSNGNGTFACAEHRNPNGWDFGLPSPYTTVAGDFNGDGKMDFMRLSGKHAYVFLSRGDGTFSGVEFPFPNGWDFGFPSSWHTVVGDFNGDGLSDFARLGSTSAHFFFSNGDGKFTCTVQAYPNGWNFGLPSAWHSIVGNFSGNGKYGYARLGGTYIHLFEPK